MTGVALTGNRWDLLAGARPAEPPRVSVIVVHYRQQVALTRTLEALGRQDHPADALEVIVVDDGSPEAPRVTDGTRLLVQDDRGFRLAAARNLGARAASGDVLLFLDADTAPEPGYVSRLARLPALAPDVVAVGRRRHLDVATGCELAEPAWLRDGYERSRDLLDADDRSYRFVIGAVTACSRSLFDASGGFDESFERYGGEDWEWAHRAWLAGATFAHVRDAVAWHDGPDWAGRPDARLAQKNAEAIRLAELVPVAGSRGRGLRGRHPEVVVTVDHGRAEGAGGWSDAARFVSVDSVLAELREATVVDADSPDRAVVLDRVRLEVQLLRPVRVGGGALRAAVDRALDRDLGRLTVTDAAGRPLLRIRSRRAEARESRWSGRELFPRETTAIDGIEPLTDEPDLEAYLGGWG